MGGWRKRWRHWRPHRLPGMEPQGRGCELCPVMRLAETVDYITYAMCIVSRLQVLSKSLRKKLTADHDLNRQVPEPWENCGNRHEYHRGKEATE